MLLRTCLFAIIFGMFFTIFIYAIPLQEKTIRNMAITGSYFFAYLFFLKKFKVNPKWLILILCCATTVIDASTLITNPRFIPLRFPFATLFPILGATLAYVYKFKKIKWFYIYTLFIGMTFYFSFIYIIPKICYDIGKREEKIIKNDFIFNNKFLTTNKDTIELNAFMKRSTLLEFYFVGCFACEDKYKVLEQINDTINSNDFGTVMICDGRYTDFDKFNLHASKNIHKGITFLYDFDSVIHKNFVNPQFSFPYEIIYSNKKQVSYFKGYSDEASTLYWNKNIKTIKNILNEKQ